MQFAGYESTLASHSTQQTTHSMPPLHIHHMHVCEGWQRWFRVMQMKRTDIEVSWLSSWVQLRTVDISM